MGCVSIQPHPCIGLLITLGLSVQAIIVPEQPSEFVIDVVGLKIINVAFDTAFFVKQRKIIKIHNSAISKSNYAEALSALLFVKWKEGGKDAPYEKRQPVDRGWADALHPVWIG